MGCFQAHGSSLSGKGKGSTVRLKLAEISGSAIDWEGAVMTKTHHLLDRSIILYTVALAGLLVLGGQNALACGNGKLLFQDKFQTVDPRWQMAAVDPTRSVGADGLSYTLAPNSAVSAINQTSLYDDYELCAHMTMKYPDEKSNAHAGLRFWADDGDNNYGFSFSSRDGTYAVYRIQKGKVLPQIPWGEPTPAVNKGSDVVNELSVVVRGNHAVFSINTQKVGELDGQPPEGGGKIGFFLVASKEDQGPSVFGVKDIEVRALQ
jgi:hypothetical protein